MKKENPSIDVVIPEEVKQILGELAEAEEARLHEAGIKQKVYPSDIARQAIAEFLKSKGYDIEVSVNRGGDRRTKN